MTARSFRGASGLTCLALKGDHLGFADDAEARPGLRLCMAPDCLSGYSMLEVLCITNCALTAVPTVLLGVRRTLRHLDLSANPDLWIDDAGLDILLHLPGLKSACIQEGERKVPSSSAHRPSPQTSLCACRS